MRLWQDTEAGDGFHGTHHVVQSLGVAADMLHEFLGQVERASPTGGYVWVTDCIAFDPALAFALLTQNGKLPMTHLRNGQYRWHGTYDEDSVLINAELGVDASQEEKNAQLKQSALALLPMPNHEHHPQVDAACILLRFLLATQGPK